MDGVSNNSFISFVRELDQTNADDIAALLEEKYGIEFTVLSVGNRMAFDRADRVVAYCCPKESNEIVFEAIMNINRELVSDNYPVRIIEVKMEQRIKGILAEAGFVGTVIAGISNIPNAREYGEKDLYAVISECPEIMITFDTIILHSDQLKKLYETLENELMSIYALNHSIKLGTAVWILSETSFSQISEMVRKKPRLTKTEIERCVPLGRLVVSVANGEMSVNEESFITALGK